MIPPHSHIEGLSPAFIRGFKAGYAAMRLERDDYAVRQIAYHSPEWDVNFHAGFITAADAAGDCATHGVEYALKSGLLTKERHANLKRWNDPLGAT